MHKPAYILISSSNPLLVLFSFILLFVFWGVFLFLDLCVSPSYPNYTRILLKALDVWYYDPAVTSPVLKLMAELVLNRSQVRLACLDTVVVFFFLNLVDIFCSLPPPPPPPPPPPLSLSLSLSLSLTHSAASI